MAAKDSPVIGKVFGGVSKNNKRRSTIVRQKKKGYKSKKGAAYPALKKTVRFLRQLSDVFVELARAISCFNKILVRLIGLISIAAVFVSIIETVWLKKPLPVQLLTPSIVRTFILRK